ncbi:hypothetical protein T440DRAFT_532408 [Plenodomus tracheiphilus IPT5]|uniref:Uncharacterized protein n=1 Tax=Plenodomus tracheiphilus IPT5 TaxID=1408161 RepID=A0A6A7B6L4_9PLEO|nr:hypothetical protein T440DRAFT_532408 [Plenodomus tracheiphilus IPT5]
MSLVNGASHLFTPDYPAVYMVSSNIMQEAEDTGGIFCGIVGHVEPADSSESDTGYGSGFDSNWKGLTPGILSRTALSLHNSARGKKRQTKELTVYEQSLPGYMQPAEPWVQRDTGDENTGLVSTSSDAGSPVLLVQQSPIFRGESYMIRAVDNSDNSMESIANELPEVSIVWLRFGVLGLIVLAGVFCYRLVMRPKKTYHGAKERFFKVKTQLQSLVAGSMAGRTDRDDTTSNIGIKGSLIQRLLKLYMSPSATDIRLEQQLHLDNLPRVSFRACERLRCRDDPEPFVSTHTTTSSFRGFATQAFVGVVASSLSLIIIGLMSGLRAGSSSKT